MEAGLSTHDVANVRVYQGIHFRFADLYGRRIGREVADWVFHHSLRPIHEGSSGVLANEDDDD